ncbi:MAG: sialate O-acetylesterase [Planctomycetota bacterium]
MQYDGDIARAKKVLAQLDKYYPGAKKYEIAGFFFWQGDKDRYNAGHANRYEKNLVHLIKQLRKDFNAPKAKFVCATLGQTKKGAQGNEGLILEAQLAVDGKTGKYKEFKGNVASVYTHPLSKGGASNGHYGGNAETYMNVGEAMGKAMAELLRFSQK